MEINVNQELTTESLINAVQNEPAIWVSELNEISVASCERRFAKLKLIKNKKAVLSQGEPRDAAVNFDTFRILQ